ncbi:phospholipid carrier-dependent glycosyltransferase [Frankia sp. CNm7]|uniref:Phospholipid carrier-dependent glycosyltransferase n=1 Tax=Frankia nepalensis TaxID=1836974 RepID=A0A937RJ53_9ACTN|nr:phospholipid carrier-dependent glycosyltransferase [Frankia nepalensis]MBL7496825.1 phospholipid carrier-dependent glycosyltransferase [Frankia nepalensis]MBL7510964.1 phospholipid carrier-dependent glycosyltransferase [Frankia nepalensis]MBL7522556.1 phospholipid carrier-dependent glycosyltransferase [Frankia nepalensis]MBL7626921.1 phospholipid carrier-dependent glycosyltransferase [Frankia nepalensis]
MVQRPNLDARATPWPRQQATTEPTISESTDTADRAADDTEQAAPDGAGQRDAAAAPAPNRSAPAPGASHPDGVSQIGMPQEPPRPRRALAAVGGLARRLPAIVLLITALHVALLATYSVIYPTWAGYDEAQHVDMVYGLQNGDGWPGPGEKMLSKGVAATSDDFDRGAYQDMFQSGGKRRGAESFAEITPTARPDRGSFDELGGPDGVTDGRLSNQMVQHPPLVYAAGAGLLWALSADDWAYDQQVYVLRVLNMLLVAPLPLLAWATARRLGLSEAVARGAAVLPLAVPGLSRVGSSFNNDGILMLSTAALTFVLAGVLGGDRRLRTAALAGAWLTVALLSKGTALPLPAMVVAAYLAGWWRTREGRPAPAGDLTARGRLRAVAASLPWTPALVALGIGAVAGGWWWVRNVVLYGALQPNGWATNPPRREPLLLPDSFWTWLWYFVQTMFNRFWAGLGMFEPPQLTPVAIVAATVVVLVLAGTGLATGLAGRGGPPDPAVPAIPAIPAQPTATSRPARRARLARLLTPAVLLLPAAFAYMTVGQRSWAEYERYTRGIAVQGRYLYLGIVGLAVVAAAGLAWLLGRRARWTPLVMLAGAVLMQAFALLAIVSYYWLGREVAFTPARVPDAAAAIARWAPFPVGVTWAILIVTAALVALTLVAVSRGAGRDWPGRPGDGDHREPPAAAVSQPAVAAAGGSPEPAVSS